MLPAANEAAETEVGTPRASAARTARVVLFNTVSSSSACSFFAPRHLSNWQRTLRMEQGQRYLLYKRIFFLYQEFISYRPSLKSCPKLHTRIEHPEKDR